MTYYVLGGTLNLALSVYLSIVISFLLLLQKIVMLEPFTSISPLSVF